MRDIRSLLAKLLKIWARNLTKCQLTPPTWNRKNRRLEKVLLLFQRSIFINVWIYTITCEFFSRELFREYLVIHKINKKKVFVWKCAEVGKPARFSEVFFRTHIDYLKMSGTRTDKDRSTVVEWLKIKEEETTAFEEEKLTCWLFYQTWHRQDRTKHCMNCLRNHHIAQI